MRLKDIKDKFFVLEHANKIYNIYDINPGSGKIQNHKYLGTICFDSRRGIAKFEHKDYKTYESNRNSSRSYNLVRVIWV